MNRRYDDATRAPGDRLSSPVFREGQVRHNHESRDLQYALAGPGESLGFQQWRFSTPIWARARPLRRSGGRASSTCSAAVAIGEVGLILSRELARLLRTDKDFCQLVELCQLFGTLIGDEENIYDTSRMDDQLVLGIKATMSVVELKVLQMRLGRQGEQGPPRRVVSAAATRLRVGGAGPGGEGSGPARARGHRTALREVPGNVEYPPDLQVVSRQ